MTCVGNCIHTLLQLSYILHQLVLIHGSAASLVSFILHQGLPKRTLVPNSSSSSSSKQGISQTGKRQGLTLGNHVWRCGSSLQQLCMYHHRMASAASLSFSTLLLCPNQNNNNNCSVSKLESNRGSRWSSRWRRSNSKPGSSYYCKQSSKL